MKALTVERRNIYSQSSGSILLDGVFREYVPECSPETGSVHYYYFDKPSLETRKTIIKIQEFIKLKVNWDSYGAIPPAMLAIKNAKDFLLKTETKNLPVYFVAPGRNGEVLIELNGEQNKTAELYFNADGSIEMLLFESDDCIFEGEYSEKQLISHIL